MSSQDQLLIIKDCLNQLCNNTIHAVWLTDGWPYGKNQIEVCQKCFSKHSAPREDDDCDCITTDMSGKCTHCLRTKGEKI